MTKKHNSDDDGYDSDKPKKTKKKIKKTTKGKKKPVKGKKKPQKIKIVNSSLATTIPPQPKPITFNQPLVSGLVDKNDAKEIEKIKNIVNKGSEIILDIKEEIKEEKRARGRPKGSKNKIVIEKEEKDEIEIPVVVEETIISPMKTRSGKVMKTPVKIKKTRGRPPKNKKQLEDTPIQDDIVLPKADATNILFPDNEDDQLIENVKSINDQLLKNLKSEKKNKPSRAFILEILKDADTSKTTKLLNEYGIIGLPEHLKKDKNKIATYIFNIANNSDTPLSSIKFYEEPENEREEMFNNFMSENLQKQEQQLKKNLIDVHKIQTKLQPKKNVTFDDSTLKDPQESLSNIGLNAGGGGFLENLMNIVAPYTPEHDSKTGYSIYG